MASIEDQIRDGEREAAIEDAADFASGDIDYSRAQDMCRTLGEMFDNTYIEITSSTQPKAEHMELFARSFPFFEAIRNSRFFEFIKISNVGVQKIKEKPDDEPKDYLCFYVECNGCFLEREHKIDGFDLVDLLIQEGVISSKENLKRNAGRIMSHDGAEELPLIFPDKRYSVQFRMNPVGFRVHKISDSLTPKTMSYDTKQLTETLETTLGQLETLATNKPKLSEQLSVLKNTLATLKITKNSDLVGTLVIQFEGLLKEIQDELGMTFNNALKAITDAEKALGVEKPTRKKKESSSGGNISSMRGAGDVSIVQFVQKHGLDALYHRTPGVDSRKKPNFSEADIDRLGLRPGGRGGPNDR